MPAIRQPSFAAGELAPSLWGRTDLARYQAGLRRCFNFFISKQGNAVSRAGAQWLGTGLATITTRTNGAFENPLPIEKFCAGDVVKLVPFCFSDTPTDPSTGTSTEQNYVLVFGNLSLMILKNGAGLAFALTGTIPYLAADLFKLRWAQSGDTLNLTCPGYPPATLKRVLTDATWSYSPLDFTRPGPQTLDPTTPEGARLATSIAFLYSPDASHPLQLWSWQVTEMLQDALGNISESAPVRVGGVFNYGDAWNSSLAWQTGTVVIGHCLVHGVSMLRGFFATGNLPAGTPLPATNASNANWTLVQEFIIGNTYGLGDVVSLEDNNPPDAFDGPTSGVWRSLTASNTGHALNDPLHWANVGDINFQLDTFPTDIEICLYPDMTQLIFCLSSTNVYAGGTTYPRWAVVNDGTGKLYQSQQAANVGNSLAVTAWWMPVVFKGFRIYRGRAGIFGFVGDSGGPTFIDTGVIPDPNLAPPEGLNPFETTPGVLNTAEAPTAVTYFQDRLIYGGTPSRPMTVLGSATSDYNDFDQHLVSVPSDSINFNLLARKREHVRFLVGLDKLFVGTSGGVWVVEGAAQSPLAADSIDAHRYVDVGTDWPNPLIIGNSLVYARDRGTGVRGIQYDWQRGGIASAQLSDAAEHLFLAYSIVDWCFAEAPWAVAWVARDDGYLLTGTNCPEDGMWAWAQHQLQGPVSNGLGGKEVISVCSITEGQEDMVYLAVKGPVITRPNWSALTTYTLGSIVNDGIGNLWYSQQNNNLNQALYLGAWWLPYGSPTGPAYLLRFSTRQTLGRVVPVCLDFWLQALAPGVVNGNVTITLCSANSAVFPNATEFLGSHWTAQMDGVVSGPYTAGAIAGQSLGLTIPINANTTPGGANPQVVNIGFLYNCELELLDMTEARTQRKTLTEVDFEVIGTGPLLVGQDSAHLVTSAQISATDQLLRVDVPGAANTAGRAFLRQPNPVPVTVVGVTRRADFDEDPG